MFYGTNLRDHMPINAYDFLYHAHLFYPQHTPPSQHKFLGKEREVVASFTGDQDGIFDPHPANPKVIQARLNRDHMRSM